MNIIRLSVLFFCVSVIYADSEDTSNESKLIEDLSSARAKDAADSNESKKSAEDPKSKNGKDEPKGSKEDAALKAVAPESIKPDSTNADSVKPESILVQNATEKDGSAKKDPVVAAANPFSRAAAGARSYIPQGYYPVVPYNHLSAYGPYAPSRYAGAAYPNSRQYSPPQYSYHYYPSQTQQPQYVSPQYSQYPQYPQYPQYSQYTQYQQYPSAPTPVSAPVPVYPALPTLYTPAIAPVVKPSQPEKPAPAAAAAPPAPVPTYSSPAPESAAPSEPASESDVKSRYVWNCEIQPSSADFRNTNSYNRYPYDQTRVNPAQYNTQSYSMPTAWGQQYGNYYTDVNQFRTAQSVPQIPAMHASQLRNPQPQPVIQSNKLEVQMPIQPTQFRNPQPQAPVMGSMPPNQGRNPQPQAPVMGSMPPNQGRNPQPQAPMMGPMQSNQFRNTQPQVPVVDAIQSTQFRNPQPQAPVMGSMPPNQVRNPQPQAPMMGPVQSNQFRNMQPQTPIIGSMPPNQVRTPQPQAPMMGPMPSNQFRNTQPQVPVVDAMQSIQFRNIQLQAPMMNVNQPRNIQPQAAAVSSPQLRSYEQHPMVSDVHLSPDFYSKLQVKQVDPLNQQRDAQPQISQQRSMQQPIRVTDARLNYTPEISRSQIWSVGANGDFIPASRSASPVAVAQQPLASQPKAAGSTDEQLYGTVNELLKQRLAGVYAALKSVMEPSAPAH